MHTILATISSFLSETLEGLRPGPCPFLSPNLPAESRLGPGQHPCTQGAWRHCSGWAMSCLPVPLPGPMSSPHGLAPTSLHPPVPASPTDFAPENWNLYQFFSLPDRLSNQALYALSLFPNYRQPWTHYTQRPHSWSGPAKPTPLSSPLGASSRLPNPLAPLTRRNHVSLPLFERKHEARPSSVPHTLTLLSKQALQLR